MFRVLQDRALALFVIGRWSVTLVIVPVYYSTDLVLKCRNESVIVHWERWT